MPLTNLIVPGGGFAKLFTAFSIERLGNATMSLAIAQTALDRSAGTCSSAGSSAARSPSSSSSRALSPTWSCGSRRPGCWFMRPLLVPGAARRAPLAASVAKCVANEAAKVVSDLALQLHGGYGYTAEYEIERLHRDSHGWALAGGTLNVQRMRIASEYLGHPLRPAPSPLAVPKPAHGTRGEVCPDGGTSSTRAPSASARSLPLIRMG